MTLATAGPCDVLLIQPSVLRRSAGEDEIVLDYFDAMSAVGTLLGDSALEPNYGLLTVAEVLRMAGFHVQYLDLTAHDLRLRGAGETLTAAHLEEILRERPAAVYGISYMTVTFGLWGRSIAGTLRRLFPNAKQIVGGIHPSMQAESVLAACPEIDVVVEGEAEGIICQVVRAFLGGSPIPALRGVRTQGHEARGEAPDYELLSDSALQGVPYPAYDLAKPYAQVVVPRVYSARGCPQRCNFCVVSDFFARNRDVESRYIREMQMATFESHLTTMVQRCRPQFFCIGDLTFAHDRAHALEVCRVVERVLQNSGSDAIWWAQTRADIIDMDIARAMYKAGCRQIAIGVEGGRDEQRKRVVKRLRTRTASDSLAMLRDLGFEIQTYWIIGLPGDDEEAVHATIDVMRFFLESELTHLTHISVLVPYPGTALYRYPEKLGIRLDGERARDPANYWMNCDPWGCGVPVYETVDKSGRTLLTADRIYELWRGALLEATGFYRTRSSSLGLTNRRELVGYPLGRGGAGK